MRNKKVSNLNGIWILNWLCQEYGQGHQKINSRMSKGIQNDHSGVIGKSKYRLLSFSVLRRCGLCNFFECIKERRLGVKASFKADPFQ
jgi:hypothetical protein